MVKTHFNGTWICLIEPWLDITDEIAPGSPPTLARGPNGNGALQFTIARYKEGPLPNFTTQALLDLLKKFGKAKEFQNKKNLGVETLRNTIVSADFTIGNDLVRAYYVSDGKNLCLATYLCDQNLAGIPQELKEADQIVGSMEFEPSGR
jgi:hypothetical protein